MNMIKTFIYHNKKKILIILGILIFLGGLKLLMYQSTSDKVATYIQNKGFTKYSSDDSFLYIKQISSLNLDQYLEKVEKGEESKYEAFYFNMNNYQVTKDKMSYEDEIDSEFSATYDYKIKKLSYRYKVVIGNANAIFDGEYDREKEQFTCDNIYSYHFDIEGKEDVFCDKILYDVK